MPIPIIEQIIRPNNLKFFEVNEPQVCDFQESRLDFGFDFVAVFTISHLTSFGGLLCSDQEVNWAAQW